jgi:hypothetical protein
MRMNARQGALGPAEDEPNLPLEPSRRVNALGALGILLRLRQLLRALPAAGRMPALALIASGLLSPLRRPLPPAPRRRGGGAGRGRGGPERSGNRSDPLHPALVPSACPGGGALRPASDAPGAQFGLRVRRTTRGERGPATFPVGERRSLALPPVGGGALPRAPHPRVLVSSPRTRFEQKVSLSVSGARGGTRTLKGCPTGS